ncbi:hypothetical protein Clacol_005673 [Clathrus columnatus]|uniref:Bacterial surface antigen (D15) domain-containing protein n=1 Tax=Clathrus columnatus TaxID=1419009 RepID=A0AAV5AHM6_9AGAM|nr:hypothetical protein Clacol_005673 [Clathrus columnatus]
MFDDEDGFLAPGLKPPLANTSAPRDLEPTTSEQLLLKWQEERLQRRLQNDYESQMFRLSELVNTNLKLGLRIRAIRVEGANHTRDSFLSTIIEPILRSENVTIPSGISDTQPETLESVLHTTRRIADLLVQTDIFSSVNPTLVKSRDPLATDKDVDVVFKCKERGRMFLQTATEIGNNEGTARLTARLRNVFGGAEKFEATLSYGSFTRQAFSANLTAPLTPDLRTVGSLAAYANDRDLSSYASCKEVLKGAKATIRTTTSLFGSHEFAYDAVLRQLTDFAPNASISIRESAGFSSKSSISHTFIRDTRDIPAAPNQGSYVKLFQELAGLGGDASFLKFEAESQVITRLGLGQRLSLSARGGILHSLIPSGDTLFNDRFQLGGPFSLRSFKTNALGPRDGNDSLGGEIYWAVGASLLGDLPRKAHWPVKTHLFVNAGRLDIRNPQSSLTQTIHASLSKPSVSAGVGIMYHLNPIRVELNFAFPLIAARSDGLQRGFQAGVGIDFL